MLTHLVIDVTFSADGVTLFTSAWDSIFEWDTSVPTQTDLKRLSAELNLWNLTYSPDGKLLATTARDSVVRLFDAETETFVKSLGEPRRDLNAPDISNADAVVRFSPYGHYVAAAQHLTVSLFDLSSGTARELPHGASVDDLDFSPNSRLIAVAGRHSEVTVWNTATGSEAFRIRDEQAGEIMAVAFSPNAKDPVLAYCSTRTHDNIVLVSLGDHSKRHMTTRPGQKHGLTFSPDGKLLVCAMDHKVDILAVKPKLQRLRTIEGAWGPVPDVSFSPDGTTLAIPCWGGFVQLWNRKVQAEVGRLTPSPKEGQWLISAEFSPNGNDLAVSVRDFGIHIYRATP